MGTILLRNGSGAFLTWCLLFACRLEKIYAEQSDAVTFDVGSVDSLISTFNHYGSLYTIPTTGSREKGYSELVYASGTTASF